MKQPRHGGLHPAALVIGIAAGVLIWLAWPWAEHQLMALSADPRPVVARGDLAADEQSTINLFEQASRSVVFINTRERVRNMWTHEVQEVPKGTGSGFIWDEFGHVVTNRHVIDGASEATVRLADGRTFPATLVGVSSRHDLAVLRIDVGSDAPPPLPVGRSGNLKVGQKVFAIGNPFGLDQTLTSGLVSALDRRLRTGPDSVIDQLIQTDAAINPGNSGGPLLDSAGRLIGVNTAIYSPSGASAGVGFAVPVDTVNRVVPQLIAKGRYEPPRLGIRTDPAVNRLIAQKFGVRGVAILGVEPGSPAAEADFETARMDGRGNLIPGDVVTGLDGQPVTNFEDLLGRLEEYRAGDRVAVSVWRAGEKRVVEVGLMK